MIKRLIMWILMLCSICGCMNESSTSLYNNPELKTEVTIKITIPAAELKTEHILSFQEQNPGVIIEIVTATDARLNAMISADFAPDVIRITSGSQLPNYVQSGIAMNLEDRINQSMLIDQTDFLPVVDLYRWNGQKVGEGALYGLPKDWSPDMTLFINKAIFEERGVEIPDYKTPLTYTQFLELSQKLHSEVDGKTTVYGSCGWDVLFTLSNLEFRLAQLGKNLWSDDFQKILLNNEYTKEIFKLINTNVQSKSVVSPINPVSVDYPELFVSGRAAILQAGYWMSGELRSNNKTRDNLENYMMLPAIQLEGGERISPCTSAVGAIISAQTKQPDEAFRFFEYYFAGEPADDRAKSGWGIPIYKSKLDMLPRESDFDKQCYDVLMDELENSKQVFIQGSPFINRDAASRIITNTISPIYFSNSINIEQELEELEIEIQNILHSSLY